MAPPVSKCPVSLTYSEPEYKKMMEVSRREIFKVVEWLVAHEGVTMENVVTKVFQHCPIAQRLALKAYIRGCLMNVIVANVEKQKRKEREVIVVDQSTQTKLPVKTKGKRTQTDEVGTEPKVKRTNVKTEPREIQTDPLETHIKAKRIKKELMDAKEN